MINSTILCIFVAESSKTNNIMKKTLFPIVWNNTYHLFGSDGIPAEPEDIYGAYLNYEKWTRDKMNYNRFDASASGNVDKDKLY